MSTNSIWRPEILHPLIPRLPTEILQEIFILCARDYHYQHLCPTKFLPNWIHVSYVCHHWRNAALEYPAPWSYLFIISPRWTKALLARSKQASLKIRISLISSPHKSSLVSCVGMVMNHVDRLQELSLRLPAPFIQHSLFGLTSRAPRLRLLNIMVEDSSVVWPSLFDGDPPVLHTLKLVGCPVPLHLFRLGSLTIFHLVNVPVQLRQSIKEFLVTLSYMQNLRHLHLHRALRSAIDFLSSAVFKTFGKIDLVHLSRLWICAPPSTIITLLSCTNIPLKTQVRLECLFEPYSAPNCNARFCSLLAQRYKDEALSIPKILSLVVYHTERGTMITFSPHERYSFRDFFPRQQPEWDHGIPLYIKLDCLMMVEDAGIVNDICSSMPLSNVQSLLVIRPLFSPDFWRRMLRKLEDVRYIRLFRGNMPDFSVLSLTDHMTHDSEGDSTQNGGELDQVHTSRILAPKLEALELKEVLFSPEDNDHSQNLSEHAITCQCLLDALSTRQGLPGRLSAHLCEIPGSGEFHMDGVWGDGGFRLKYLNVFPLSLSEDSEDEGSESFGEEDDSDNDDEDSDYHHLLEESVHFPVVDP